MAISSCHSNVENSPLRPRARRRSGRRAGILLAAMILVSAPSVNVVSSGSPVALDVAIARTTPARVPVDSPARSSPVATTAPAATEVAVPAPALAVHSSPAPPDPSPPKAVSSSSPKAAAPVTHAPVVQPTRAVAAQPASDYGCAAALAYLRANAAPGFTFSCPGNAYGHQAMTCYYHAPQCPVLGDHRDQRPVPRRVQERGQQLVGSHRPPVRRHRPVRVLPLTRSSRGLLVRRFGRGVPGSGVGPAIVDHERVQRAE